MYQLKKLAALIQKVPCVNGHMDCTLNREVDNIKVSSFSDDMSHGHILPIS